MHLKDKNGHSARDGIRDKNVLYIHDIACLPWSEDTGAVFPKDFRNAALTLALCHLRIRNERRNVTCREISIAMESIKQYQNDIVANKIRFIVIV